MVEFIVIFSLSLVDLNYFTSAFFYAFFYKESVCCVRSIYFFFSGLKSSPAFQYYLRVYQFPLIKYWIIYLIVLDATI